MNFKKFWKTLNSLYERLLIFVLIIVLLIVAYCMYDAWYLYEHTLDDSILKYKPDVSSDGAEDSPITDDMVAWITIDDTNIDYPVMQGSDNVKYLNTDPFGEYSLSGSIFLDSRNAPDFTDSYSLIYGHHMEYGKMFGALDDFLNRDYLESHTSGTLMIGKNAEKTFSLEVFACMETNAAEEIAFTPGVSAEIRQYIKDHAKIYKTERSERIIGLSTCAEGDTVGRIIVFCYILE